MEVTSLVNLNDKISQLQMGVLYSICLGQDWPLFGCVTDQFHSGSSADSGRAGEYKYP